MSRYTRATAKEHAQLELDSSKGYISALAAGFFGSLVSILVFLSQELMPASQLVFFRFLLAVFILFIPARKHLITLKWKDAVQLIILGLIGGMSVLCFYSALQQITTSTAVALTNLSLPLITLYSVIFLKVRFSLRDLSGFFLMLTALYLLMYEELEIENNSGFYFSIIASIFLAAYCIVKNFLVNNIDSMAIVFMVSLISAIMALTITTGEWTNIINFQAAVIITSLAICATAASYLHSLSYKYIDASKASAIIKVNLIWTVLLTLILFQTIPSIREATSYVLILSAVILLQNIKISLFSKSIKFKINNNTIRSTHINSLQHYKTQLGDAISLAERQSSCEFKIHFDFKTQKGILKNANHVFQNSGLQHVELDNGVLLAYYHQQTEFIIVLGKGIRGRIPSKTIKNCKLHIDTLLKTTSLPETLIQIPSFLSNAFSEVFPYALDDLNEVSDDISFVYE